MTGRSKNSGEKGSVLMETILVIPLYIAFFSGIFMLGDLGLGRSRLTAGDRFAVWLAGNRHVEKDDAAVKKVASGAFFPKSDFAEGTELKSFSSNKSKVNFYAVVRGSSELKLALPAWAVGARKGVINLLADVGTKPDAGKWDDVSFRARESDGKYTHSVLMRTRYDLRDRPGRVLAQGAPLWHVECRTPYVGRNGVPDDRPAALNVTGVTEYVRNPQFVSWSR